MKNKNTPRGDHDAKAKALEYYQKLEMKEAAKRKVSSSATAGHHSSTTPTTPPNAPRKATKTVPSRKVAAAAATAASVPTTHRDDDDAKLRARQYYHSIVLKMQEEKKKDPLPTPPLSTVHKTNATPSLRTTTNPTSTTAAAQQKNARRMIDILYHDMSKLEEMEETESKEPPFQGSTTTLHPSAPAASSSGTAAATAMPSPPPIVPNLVFGSTGNTFGRPFVMDANPACSSHPFRNETTTTNKPRFAAPNLYPPPKLTTTPSPPPPRTRTEPYPQEPAASVKVTDHGGWFWSRLFTALDVLVLALLYMLEIKFHILSSIGIALMRSILYGVWKVMIVTYRQGLDLSNIPTTLLVGVGGWFVVVRGAMIRPSTLLLESLRRNRTMRNDRIQSHVTMVLNMVYHELQKQQDVNVPLRTLQTRHYFCTVIPTA